MLMSNQVDFRGEKITRDKEGHTNKVLNRNEEFQNR